MMRLGSVFDDEVSDVFVRDPAQKGIVFFSTPVHREPVQGLYKTAHKTPHKTFLSGVLRIRVVFQASLSGALGITMVSWADGGKRGKGGRRPKRARIRPAQDSPQDRAQDFGRTSLEPDPRLRDHETDSLPYPLG